MVAKLIAEEGLLKDLVLSLKEGDEWVLGRDPEECQLVIEDPAASRKHMVIRQTAEGYLIENLSDTNPVMSNDEEIEEPTPLNHGDVLTIGNGKYRFYSEEEPEVELKDEDTSIDEDEPAPEEESDREPASIEEEFEPQEEEPQAETDVKDTDTEPEAKEEQAETAKDPQEEVKDDQPEPEATDEQVEEEPRDEESKAEADVKDDESEVDQEPQKTEDEPAIPEESGEDMTVMEEVSEETLETEESLPEIDEEERHDSLFEEETALGHEEELAHADIDLTETSNWILKIIAGPNNGAEYGMEEGSSYIIGSDPSVSDIILQDVSVSRKHAKVTVTEDNRILIEDLNSSNGTNIEGDNINEETELPSNTVASLGTTSFIVYNIEGEQTTVVSPLLPAIAKVIQESEKRREEESKKRDEEQQRSQKEREESAKKEEEAKAALPPPAPEKNYAKLVFTIIAAGLVLTTGFGVTKLFVSKEIEAPKVEPIKEIDSVLAPYTKVTYSYTKETGRILLVGHVLTNVERNHLIYSLNVLPFINNIDDKIVVDEFIWGEINQVIAKNPSWRGIAIHSPSAGKFVISGYLENRQQAEMLNDYLNQNFPYLDLLDRRIIVEEDVESQIKVLLASDNFDEVTVDMDSGDVTLRGDVPFGSKQKLDELITKVRKVNGVRTVKAFVTELPLEESVVNISNRYKVTGSSSRGKEISVVIKGRIYSKGDTLDGMEITEISPTRITLERAGVKYVIDYNQ